MIPCWQNTEKRILENTADYPFDELMPDFFVPLDSYPVPKVVKDS